MSISHYEISKMLHTLNKLVLAGFIFKYLGNYHAV